MTKWTNMGRLLLLIVLFAGFTPAGAAEVAAPNVDLIVDGGFEAGGAAWTQNSTAGHTLISGDYVRAGALAAYLAGANATVDRISQTVTVPHDVAVRLSFWWALHTAETGAPADTLRVNVRDTSGGLLKTIVTLNNTLLEPYLWEPRDYDLSAFGGQTIRLEFVATTDVTGISGFWVDEVSVQTGGPLRKTFLPLVTR